MDYFELKELVDSIEWLGHLDKLEKHVKIEVTPPDDGPTIEESYLAGKVSFGVVFHDGETLMRSGLAITVAKDYEKEMVKMFIMRSLKTVLERVFEQTIKIDGQRYDELKYT
jgi:hypothetical protein